MADSGGCSFFTFDFTAWLPMVSNGLNQKRFAMKSLCLNFTGLLFIFATALTPLLADDKKTPAENTATASSEVMLTAGTWKDVETLVKSHKGKIVVVDIWSTSCLPCMTEFPNLVKIHDAHKDQIVCISFNVDYVGIKKKGADYYRPRVEEFLKKENAAFTNFLCTTESDKVFQTLELSSIPAVYVYDAQGKLAQRFDDSMLEDGEEEAFTYEKDINPLLKKLLTQQK